METARLILTGHSKRADVRASGRVEVTWEELISCQHERRAEKDGPGFSLASYAGPCRCGRQLVRDANGKVKQAPCPDLDWQEGQEWTGHRLDANVLEVTALGLDLDKRLLPDGKQADIDGPTAQAAIHRLQTLGYRAWIYSTHSFKPPEKFSLRAIVPLSRPVPRADWRRFWHAAIAHLGIFVQNACQNEARFWYLPSAPEGAEVVNVAIEGEPLDVDAILATAEQPAPDKPSDPPQKPSETVDPGILDHVRRELRDHGPAIEGSEGDPHTFRAACICRDYGLSEDDALALLSEWNTTCRPPWSLDELADKVTNAYLYASGTEGSARLDLAILRVAEEAEKSGPFAELAQDAASGDPWAEALLRAKADLDAYRGTGENASGKLAAPAFAPAVDLLTTDFPPTPWLIQGLVTEQSVGITSAEPKSIKTWLELENALAVASGTPSVGEFETGPPRPVALFLAEDDSRSARNRLRALAASRGLDPGDALRLMHVCCRQHLDLTNDADLIWIIASCRQIKGLALVVMDPLRNVHSGEENDSTGMADVMGRLRTIRDIVGCAVRVPHHAKKEASGRSDRGGQNMRGSSAIHGALDCGLYLDGLDTDGKSEWKVRVSVEIKAARGAGAFDLRLNLNDDANGEALRAVWSVERGEAPTTKAGRAQRELETLLGEILSVLVDAQLTRGKDSLGINAILTKVRGGRTLNTRALELGEERGFVVQSYKGDRPLGWSVTDAGRKWLAGPPAAPAV